jgi:histidine triad (HIT) family protein
MTCVFCKVATHEQKASIVYETDNVIAFDDMSPMAAVHVLVIPKKHAEQLNELDSLKEIFEVIAKVASIKGVVDGGYRVVLNKGKDAGQAVDHLHFHVLGGRQMKWPPG